MKNLLLSLCAVAPLLLRAEGISDVFENEDENVYLYKSFQEGDDSVSSTFLETEPDKDHAAQEPVSLEVFDLADGQIEQESNSKWADAQIKQAPSKVAPSEQNMCQDQTLCMPDIQPYQVNVRHTERKGIGYNKGYTTLEGLFTYSKGKYIPFLDLRGHVFDNGRLAANVGIGTRYVLNPSNSMVGINTYYDYRALKHAHFNQWGVGLEGFYNRWEARINGYLPVGRKRIVSDHHLNGITFKGFAGNNLLINESYTDKIISAKKGFDLEIGVHPFKIMRDWDCIVSAGPYYFGGEGKSSWGGKARLKVELAKYLFVELSDSYDKVFHNRFQGTLAVSIPFGGKKCYPKKSRNGAGNDCFANNIMAWRGVQPVQRQEIIVAQKETKSYIIDPIANDPATGKPIFITFINNNGISPGNGTFESPYTTLANAQANTGQGSIVYVYGTSTAYAAPWFLEESQRFLGSAAAHDFNTTKGTVTVPIQTNLFPLIQNSNGNMVTTVASVTNIEVSGIAIQQVTGGANEALVIQGQNIIVTKNRIIGAASGGASSMLINCSGNALIDSNIVSNNNEIGINFRKDPVVSPDGQVSATITNNLVYSNQIGISISYFGNVTNLLKVNIANNIASNNSGNGISFGGANAKITTIATVNSNTSYNNGNNGIQFFNLSNAKLNVFDNTSTSNANFGISFQPNVATQTYCVSLHDNIASSNGTADYGFTNSSGATLFTEPFVNDIGSFDMIGVPPVPVPACFCQFCFVDND